MMRPPILSSARRSVSSCIRTRPTAVSQRRGGQDASRLPRVGGAGTGWRRNECHCGGQPGRHSADPCSRLPARPGPRTRHRARAGHRRAWSRQSAIRSRWQRRGFGVHAAFSLPTVGLIRRLASQSHCRCHQIGAGRLLLRLGQERASQAGHAGVRGQPDRVGQRRPRAVGLPPRGGDAASGAQVTRETGPRRAVRRDQPFAHPVDPSTGLALARTPNGRDELAMRRLGGAVPIQHQAGRPPGATAR
jgi:hypothetical protein